MEEIGYMEEAMQETAEEEYSVNEEAEKIILLTEQKKAGYKRDALNEMLTYINDVCKKNNIKYYAAGRLLTFWQLKEDPYPDNYTYEIRMLRKNYDVFAGAAKDTCSENGLTFNGTYYGDKRVKKPTLTIGKKVHLEEDQIDFSITMKVIPVDRLPSDKKERISFQREVLKQNRIYTSISAYTDRKGMSKLPFSERMKKKLKLKLRYNHVFFNSFSEKYKKLLTRYEEDDSADYLGRLELLVSEPVESSLVLPVKTESFLDTELMIPAHPEQFTLLPQHEYNQNIRDIRCRALRRFDIFCKRYHITYFAFASLLVECIQGENAEEKIAPNWRVGFLRDDYERAVQLLRTEGKDNGLSLKEYQDSYPNVLRKEKGFLALEDDRKDVLGKTYQVLMEPFDYLPADLDKEVALKAELKELRDMDDIMKKQEQGKIYPRSKYSLAEHYQKEQDVSKRYSHLKDAQKVFRLYTGFGNNIPVTELFPVQRRSLHGIEINVPANEFQWFRKGDEQFTESVIAQKTKLLKIIHEICETNQIPYFAISKLLIGAVVYHDVIPNGGNYTLDLGLIRKDYEALTKYLREHGKDHGVFLKEFRDTAHKYPQLTKTVTFIGKEYSRSLVRLLPFDRVPESFYTRKAFRDKMKENNKRINEAINFRLGQKEKYETLYSPEEMQALEKEYAQIDLLAYAAEIDKMAQEYNEDPLAFSYERVAFAFSRIIDEDDLFPLQKQSFRDIEICCPRDYSIWQPIQDEALKYQVACIQEADKKLIREFDRVCQKLNLGYFVCGGTMLGYMRHKGFIPWDDDVDVAMLREDYDRFIAEAGPYLGEEFFLQTRETDPNIPYLFSKIRLNGTEYCTDYNLYRDFHKGICLDIFPFDYVPNGKAEREKFVSEVLELSREHNLIVNNQFPDMPEPFPPRNEKEEQMKEEQKELIRSYWDMSLKESQNRYIEKATMYNSTAKEKGLKTVASFVPSYTYIDLNDLLPYQRGMFEGIEVSVPKRPDIFLEMQYGDYMELPPLHMRVAHRLIRWSTGDAGADNVKKRDYSNIGGDRE